MFRILIRSDPDRLDLVGSQSYNFFQSYLFGSGSDRFDVSLGIALALEEANFVSDDIVSCAILNGLAAALLCEVSVFTENIIVLQGLVLSRFRIGTESISVDNPDPACPFLGGKAS